ncbi:MAG: mannan endo-1,4-beta-mannosidase A and B [Clostridia bacterium]|nr:mannan endo-1,4-beta-mannosidase A and B [Clostridia bacterium]
MNKKRSILIVILLAFVCFIALFALQREEKPILSNGDATQEAREIFDYISNLDGEFVLSGQQESTWMGSCDYEIDYIFASSGKQPVIKGFDYMNDDFQGVNRRAEEWWNNGGIVTICWHCGSDFSGEWKDSMEDEVANWDVMLTEGTAEYNSMISGMDKAAKALLELKEKNIPVLWRPFHEFDGHWFWWSKGGADAFRQMWIIMYQRYTEYWKLDNLIWVLGFSDQGEKSRDWYPGDEYCDIIGADTYQLDIFTKLYRKMQRITSKSKLVCLHECGANPTVDELEKAPWVWFMTWHTEYLTDNNTKEDLNKLYNSDIVITLDEFSLRKQR